MDQLTPFERWWIAYAQKHDLLRHAAGEKFMHAAEAAWKASEDRKAKRRRKRPKEEVQMAVA